MNKIYKVVWNKARNCYVVASEFAKNHQTGSSRIKAASVAAVMAATMLTIGTGVIYAADVTDTGVKESKETILFDNTTGETTMLNDPNLKHDRPGSWVHGHTAECGELTYNTTLTIGDINKVVDKLVDNDTLLYNQGIQKVTMNNGTISLIRNDNTSVTNSIALTGNGGENGQDTAVTVAVGNESQTFQTGSVVTANTDNSGKATGLTINGQSYDIKAGKTYKAGENVTIADDGTISATDTTYSAGKNVRIDDKNKISVDLSEYAKSDDVAVVYQDNDKNKSLHSTNAGTVGSSSIALGKEATTGMGSVALGDQTKATGESSTAIGVKAEATALDSIAIGGETKATGGDSIAIGNDTTANSQYSVAIGDDIHSTGVSATAVGQQAHATGNYSTALGAMTNVDADWNKQHPGEWRKSGEMSTAIGYGSGSWGDYSTAIGGGYAKAEGQFATAIGSLSQATAENTVALGGAATAEGRFATAIGTSSQATAENAVALGGAATANVYGGVALGTSSVADRAAGVVGAFAPEGADGLTWKANAGAVSVGSSVEGKKITRQITNVAAGTADTDAVNVAQLKKVSEAVASASQGWKLKTQNGNASDVKPGATVEFDGDANIQVGNDGNKVSVTLKKQLTGIQSITGEGEGAGSISFANDGIKFNNKVTIDNTGKISGVAAGAITETSTDAVNGSQLHAVATEAGKHTTLSNGKNTTVNPVTTADGHLEYKVDVNDELKDIKSIIGAGEGAGSISFADGGIKLNNKVTINKDGKITGVAAGVEKTDAVNVGQLTDYVAANDTHIKSGNYAVGEVTDSTGNKSQGVSMDIVNKEGKVTGTVTITDVAKASDVGEVNNIDSDIKNQNGSHTTVVDAVNNLNQKLNNKVGDLNYVEGGKGNYVTNGENTTTSIGKLDQALKDVAATAAKHTTVTQGDNITVTPGTNTDGSKNYNVALKKDITVESVTANTFKADQTVMNKDGLKVGNKVSVSATAVTAGKTSISDEGVKVGGKTYISDKGLNANDQKVTNVAAGELSATSKDAVNGSQLYETNQAIANNATNISSLSHSISNLDNRVNKVGAGAAALAALHPLDFDPDAKWDFAAGYGNYRGANAAAVGAYYRPNEDTMFSVGGTFGNGENMVNAGVSFKLGSGSSHVSTSRVAMAKEIKELRGELEAMKSAMLDANAGKKIDTSKLQLFPDVPQNHWAYEYVAQLAGNGMIEGYPDGNFAGDRPMTRYEFAAILYRAMTKGAVLSDKILSEFSHELEYFTVDTIAKDKAGNPTIQRVRIVKENKNK